MEREGINFEKTLPCGYTAKKTVDVSDRRLSVFFLIAQTAANAAAFTLGYLVIRPPDFWSHIVQLVFVFGITAALYILLHELVHGAVYKVMTGEKLKFGLNAKAAFCGVPEIFVYRKCAIAALSAPLVFFGVLFAAGMIFVKHGWLSYYFAVMLGFHLGGCSGDIYGIILFLVKFRSPRTLIRDIGPVQTFYTDE